MTKSLEQSWWYSREIDMNKPYGIEMFSQGQSNEGEYFGLDTSCSKVF